RTTGGALRVAPSVRRSPPVHEGVGTRRGRRRIRAGQVSEAPVKLASAREGFLAVPGAGLHYRTIGSSTPLAVLPRGPHLDHHSLLPELDGLADGARLIYYDQRGRGRSSDGVAPEDVTVESEVEDLDRLRRHFGLATLALLGHSWGAVLALEYATRHPDRTS